MIYDSKLKCYFDPSTNEYFELKGNDGLWNYDLYILKKS